MKYFMLREEYDAPLIAHKYIFSKDKYIENIIGLEEDAKNVLNSYVEITLMINIENINHETIIMLIAVVNACNDLGVRLSIMYLDGTNPCYHQDVFCDN